MGNKLILPSIQKKAYFSVLIPLVVVLIIGLAVLTVSKSGGYSFLLGGMLWFIPQGVVAIRLFRRIEADPKRFIVAFYKNEVLKLILAACLFILVVKWIPLSILSFLGGYLCAQVVFWILMSVMS